MTPKPGSSAAPGPSVWLRPAGPSRLPVRPLLPTLGWQHQRPRPHLGDVHPPLRPQASGSRPPSPFLGRGVRGALLWLTGRTRAAPQPLRQGERWGSSLPVVAVTGPHAEWLKTAEMCLSRFWRPEVRDRGPAGLCSLRVRGLTFLDLQMHLSNLCLHHHRAALSPHFPFSGVTG